MSLKVEPLRAIRLKRGLLRQTGKKVTCSQLPIIGRYVNSVLRRSHLATLVTDLFPGAGLVGVIRQYRNPVPGYSKQLENGGGSA